MVDYHKSTASCFFPFDMNPQLHWHRRLGCLFLSNSHLSVYPVRIIRSHWLFISQSEEVSSWAKVPASSQLIVSQRQKVPPLILPAISQFMCAVMLNVRHWYFNHLHRSTISLTSVQTWGTTIISHPVILSTLSLPMGFCVCSYRCSVQRTLWTCWWGWKLRLLPERVWRSFHQRVRQWQIYIILPGEDVWTHEEGGWKISEPDTTVMCEWSSFVLTSGTI